MENSVLEKLKSINAIYKLFLQTFPQFSKLRYSFEKEKKSFHFIA